MTDLELADYLCITDMPNWPQLIAKLSPEKRAAYERFRVLEDELDLWLQGGHRPQDVILCLDRCDGRKPS